MPKDRTAEETLIHYFVGIALGRVSPYLADGSRTAVCLCPVTVC